MLVEREDIDAELEYLRKIADGFGEVLPSMPGQSVTVGKTSSTLLSSNENRRYAIIVNDSAHTIYLALGSTARVNEGIRLNSGGGGYEITALNLYRGEVTAVSAFGNCNVTLMEG